MRRIENIVTGKNKKWVMYLISFLLPAVILAASYAISGIAPFGDKTLAYSDAYGQYNTFYNFYRSLLSGDRDLFYSFEKVLGDGITSLFAYYIASPWNLLYLLVPEADTLLATDLIILLKASFCGLTMAIYFDTVSGLNIKTLLFTTAYALCGYNMAFCFNSMWIDSVIMLPVVAIGLEKLTAGESPFLYIVSLGLSILFNFYTGYMLCIFSVIYFACIIYRKNMPIFQMLRTGERFAFASLLAGGSSAVLLLPTVKALSHSGSGSGSLFGNYLYAAAMRVLQILHLNEGGLAYKAAVCAVCGFLLVIAALVVITLRKPESKSMIRTVSAIVCIALVLVFYFCVDKNLQDHYFAVSDGLNVSARNFIFGEAAENEPLYGGPFVYIGILNFMLALTFFFNSGISQREKLGVGMLAGILVISMLFYIPNVIWHGLQENNCFNYRYSFMLSFVLLIAGEKSSAQLQKVKVRDIWLCAAALAVMACGITIAGHADFIRLAKTLSVTLLYAALATAAIRHSSDIFVLLAAVIQIAVLGIAANTTLCNEADNAMTMSEYQTKTEAGNQRMEALKELDSGFYRVREEKTTLNHNDAMQFGFNGATHYSSTQSPEAIEFLASIGIRTRSERWAQYGPATRAADAFLDFRYDFSGQQMLDYQQVAEEIYYNPYTLPLAYACNEAVLTDSMPETGNAFETLNTIYEEILGENETVFYTASTDVKQQDQIVTVETAIKSDDALYAWIYSKEIESVNVYLNGSLLVSRKSLYSNETLPLGIFDAGDHVTVEFCFTGEAQLQEEECYFYYESTEILQKTQQKLSGTINSFETKTDSELSFQSSTEEENVIMITVPFDSGWKVTVDGVETNAEKALGVFIAVHVPAGSHSIELKYTPAGLKAGIIISAVSVVTLAVWCTIDFRKQSRKKRNCPVQ